MASVESDRQKLLYTAKVAEQAELYEEMVDVMVERCKIAIELSDEERNLLSVAFKNLVGGYRTSYRVIMGVDHKCHEDEVKSTINKQLKEKVAKKLDEICLKVDEIITKHLIPNVANVENKVFLIKMKADYSRYRCETAAAEDKKKLAAIANEHYDQAYKLAAQLQPANPVRLGLALNYSVFYYEIDENSGKACALAQTAFDDAIAELDNQNDDSPSMSTKDSTLIMQLLRDNLTLWKSECSNAEDPDQN